MMFAPLRLSRRGYYGCEKAEGLLAGNSCSSTHRRSRGEKLTEGQDGHTVLLRCWLRGNRSRHC